MATISVGKPRVWLTYWFMTPCHLRIGSSWGFMGYNDCNGDIELYKEMNKEIYRDISNINQLNMIHDWVCLNMGNLTINNRHSMRIRWDNGTMSPTMKKLE